MVKCRLQRGAVGRLLLQQMGVILHKLADRAADKVQIGVHRAVSRLQGARDLIDGPPAPHRKVERYRRAQHDRGKNQEKHLVAQGIQLPHCLLFRKNSR